MFPIFSLTLMVNHACNLRCAYCYTGFKFHRRMTTGIAEAAIRHAARSTEPGGRLELGFFGGEPLLEALAILDWIEQARECCAVQQVDLRLNLTTNGTVDDPAARRVMSLPELSLSLSHDGLPEVHDRHRQSADGKGSSNEVLATLDRLVAAGREFNVVMVVRPDSLRNLADGIEFLRARGARQFTPSLDLWTQWTRDDAAQLPQTVSACADLWRQSWPDLSISWFDEKTARLARVPLSSTARCQFGHGQIAVSPAGHLYPCERLIGEDRDDNPMRLVGHVLDEDPFCRMTPFPDRAAPACSECVLESMCGSSCRCSNFIRTGDPTKPDGLLCWLETLCFRETARVWSHSQPAQRSVASVEPDISLVEVSHV